MSEPMIPITEPAGKLMDDIVFLLLCDVIMGEPNQASDTEIWTKPPRGHDRIEPPPKNISALNNDEYVVFNPDFQRIRYIIEFVWDR